MEPEHGCEICGKSISLKEIICVECFQDTTGFKQEYIETNIPSRATIFPGWMLRYGWVDLHGDNWLKCDTFLNPSVKEICDVVSRFIEDNNRPEWMIIDDDPEPKPDRPDLPYPTAYIPSISLYLYSNSDVDDSQVVHHYTRDAAEYYTLAAFWAFPLKEALFEAKECLGKDFLCWVLIELISAVSHDLAMFSNESPQKEFNEMVGELSLPTNLLKSLPWTDRERRRL